VAQPVGKSALDMLANPFMHLSCRSRGLRTVLSAPVLEAQMGSNDSGRDSCSLLNFESENRVAKLAGERGRTCIRKTGRFESY
jgi:hypothetical protein